MWVKGLQDLGHDVQVIAPELPEDIDGLICPHPNPDPATAIAGRQRLRDIAREWLLWPDPDIRWTKRAVALAKASVHTAPDIILTTSPPESVHAAGKLLKSHWPQSQWYADARDHWFVRAFRKGRRQAVRAAIETRIARHILSRADVLFSVNELISEEFKRLAPGANHVVVPHFLDAVSEAHDFGEDGFHLVHTGSFALSDPDARIERLLEPFARACEANPKLRLHLIGRLRDDEVTAVEASSARARITLYGVVPLNQALAMQKGASALAVVAADNAPVPPGKMEEYRVSGRPVIAFGEGDWRRHVDTDPRPAETRLLDLAASEKATPQPPADVIRAADIVDEAFASAGVIQP